MRPERSAQIAVLGLCAAVVVALAVGAAGDRSDAAFSLGVGPQQALAITASTPLCQDSILVPADFDSVQLALGTYKRPGPPLEVVVNRAGRDVASGVLAPGYADGQPQTVRVGKVSEGDSIRVCMSVQRGSKVAVYGGPGAAAFGTAARREGEDKVLDFDVALRFYGEKHSLLAQIPTMFERASLFRPGWVTPTTYWLLLVLVVLAVPWLLARAVARAAARGLSDESASDATRPAAADAPS